MITVLAGGVGAARFLQGLVKEVPPQDLTIIVNTGDDLELFGLHISPDIDIVLYHLAGLADEARGWGIAGDTFQTVEALARFGYPTWFRLGDRDLATCIHRSNLLSEGSTLSEATAHLARAFDIQARILPMSNEYVPTKVETEDGLIDFQRFMVERGAKDHVRRIHFHGIHDAQPAPGVLNAIAEANAVVIAPSNPLVSIGPILAVSGVVDALKEARARIAAVSPIVGGAAIKGPAANMLRDFGYEASAAIIAKLYADFLDVLVIDNVDAALAPEIRALRLLAGRQGLDVVITDTIMKTVEVKVALARTVLAALDIRP